MAPCLCHVSLFFSNESGIFFQTTGSSVGVENHRDPGENLTEGGGLKIWRWTIFASSLGKREAMKKHDMLYFRDGVLKEKSMDLLMMSLD